MLKKILSSILTGVFANLIAIKLIYADIKAERKRRLKRKGIKIDRISGGTLIPVFLWLAIVMTIMWAFQLDIKR